MKTASLIIGALIALVATSLAAVEINPAAGAEVVVSRGKAPTRDGVLSPGEWNQAKRIALTGGNELLLMHDGAFLDVGLRTAASSVGSICVDRGNIIAVLHASAALGTARYERAEPEWRLTKRFAWSCRPGTPAEKLQARQAKLQAEEGWPGTPAESGTPEHMEYIIAMPAGTLRLAVAYRDMDDGTLSGWSQGLDDGSQRRELISGNGPPTLRLSPGQWIALRGEESDATPSGVSAPGALGGSAALVEDRLVPREVARTLHASFSFLVPILFLSVRPQKSSATAP